MLDVETNISHHIISWNIIEYHVISYCGWKQSWTILDGRNLLKSHDQWDNQPINWWRISSIHFIISNHGSCISTYIFHIISCVISVYSKSYYIIHTIRVKYLNLTTDLYIVIFASQWKQFIHCKHLMMFYLWGFPQMGDLYIIHFKGSKPGIIWLRNAKYQWLPEWGRCD